MESKIGLCFCSAVSPTRKLQAKGKSSRSASVDGERNFFFSLHNKNPHKPGFISSTTNPSDAHIHSEKLFFLLISLHRYKSHSRAAALGFYWDLGERDKRQGEMCSRYINKWISIKSHVHPHMHSRHDFLLLFGNQIENKKYNFRR